MTEAAEARGAESPDEPVGKGMASRSLGDQLKAARTIIATRKQERASFDDAARRAARDNDLDEVARLLGRRAALDVVIVAQESRVGEIRAAIRDVNAEARSLFVRNEYIYEYDEHGNWIKRLEKDWADYYRRPQVPEPKAVQYRTITYYQDDPA